MRVGLDCFPCFLRQAIIAVRLGTKDEALQTSILRSTLEDVFAADLSRPPAFATTFLHRRIRQMLGADPFKEIKSKYNRIAFDLYPSLRSLVDGSEDPLWTATRLAIAGNIIDFGIFTSIDVQGTIARALNEQPAVDDYESFRHTISETDEILYLLDNAGEIVFDRLLIETLISRGKKVKAVVKGGPVLNDSTREDAEESGLTGVCEVVDNGSDSVGTDLDNTPPSFRKMFGDARLIISKGQANFETLTGNGKTIFFLFQSKCDVISKELGLSVGSMLLKKS